MAPKDYFTVRELADRFTNGNYHELYHLIRKGALEVERPAHYRVRVSSTSARVVFDIDDDDKR